MTTPEPKSENLAETENFFVWKSDEPDGEVLYHLEWNQVTLSFFQEEWDEFLKLIGEVLHPAAKK